MHAVVIFIAFGESTLKVDTSRTVPRRACNSDNVQAPVRQYSNPFDARLTYKSNSVFNTRSDEGMSRASICTHTQV